MSQRFGRPAEFMERSHCFWVVRALGGKEDRKCPTLSHAANGGIDETRVKIKNLLKCSEKIGKRFDSCRKKTGGDIGGGVTY